MASSAKRPKQRLRLGYVIELILEDSDSEASKFGGNSDTLDSESSSDIESESSRQELGFRG